MKTKKKKLRSFGPFAVWRGGDGLFRVCRGHYRSVVGGPFGIYRQAELKAARLLDEHERREMDRISEMEGYWDSMLTARIERDDYAEDRHSSSAS